MAKMTASQMSKLASDMQSITNYVPGGGKKFSADEIAKRKEELRKKKEKMLKMRAKNQGRSERTEDVGRQVGSALTEAELNRMRTKGTY